MPFLIAAMVFTAIGTAYGAYSSYQQGQAQKRMSEYQAKVTQQQAALTKRTAEENAALVERARAQNVSLVQIQAQQDTAQLQRKYAIIAGAQRAARAASGIGGGSVSEGDIATDTLGTLKHDEDQIRYNAALATWEISQGAGIEAWKLKRKSGLETWGLGSKARMYKLAGESAAAAGSMRAVSTILEGASSMASMGYAASQ